MNCLNWKDRFAPLCTVNGLDDFEVGLSNVFPAKHSPISAGSYTVCGRHRGAVGASETITINCGPLITQRFHVVVVVRTAADGARPERLCIAEVGVYASELSRSCWCLDNDGAYNDTDMKILPIALMQQIMQCLIWTRAD